VAGRFVAQLNNSLTQIGIDHFDSVSGQERIQVTLFGQHRLALRNAFHTVPLQDLEDQPIVRRSVGRPMDLCPDSRRTIGKLFEIISQMRDRVHLDRSGFFAQEFPFRQARCRSVTFGTNKPESLVMPARAGQILDKSSGLPGVIG
jgi:hypothetical protein